jgi:hypothetical protein
MQINRRQELAQASLISGAVLSGCATGGRTGGVRQRQTRIRPGEVWLDTSGRPVQAGVPPDTREGIACFQRGGKVYLTNSMMSGYFPNPSRAAVAESPNGPFTNLGDLHLSDLSRSSFNSQISYIRGSHLPRPSAGRSPARRPSPT